MKIKYQKTQEQCANILQARQLAIKKCISRMQDKKNKNEYNGTNSQYRETIDSLRLEDLYLDKAINMLYDNRQIDIILQTDYCTGKS